jgi:O-antigen/teichoic acid export membrane protein
MCPSITKLIPAIIRIRLDPLLAAPSFGNSVWLISDRLIRMGLGLLVGVWVARYLGPEGYGQLSFAGSYVMIFSAIALFGLESIVVRELVKHPEAERAILGTTCLIRTAAGLFSYLLAIVVLLVLRPDDRTAVLLVALLGSSLLVQAVEASDLWFQSRVLSRYTVICRSTAFIISSGLKVLLVLTGASLTAIAAATAVEALLAALLLVIVHSRQSGVGLLRWRLDHSWFRRLLTGSVPMVLSGVVLMVYLRIDQVMLGALASQAEVGLYAAAVRISEVWYFVPSAIVSSVFPGLVALRSTDPEQFERKLQQLYNLLAFLGYAVALPVTFIAPWLVRLLFGSAYQTAAPLLAVLIWAGLFANLSVVRNAHFIALDWGRSLLWATSLGATSNVLLNLLLIPRYGALGAAIATCLSYWVAAHGACYTSRQMWPAGGMILRALVLPRFW